MTEIQDREPKRKENAEKKKRFIQAFKQAPWRNHVQVAGFFLLSLVILLLVASVYLSISGQAAAAGLEAYRLNLDRTDLERQIADRKSQIANLTSSPSMEKRALDMGFERIDPEDAVYISIPGYGGRESRVSAPPPWIDNSGIQINNSLYRQSLWDWLFTGVNLLSESLSGGSDK
jgi:cell division protein FtsL